MLLSLKKFAQGFALQKGRIFGFGENANDDTGSVLKISALSAAELEEIDQNKIQVHNIGEERSVGLFNYEIGIRDKKNIEAASRKMILSKASDLLKKESCSLHRMRSQAKEIKELKVAWNERMAKLQDKGYSVKEMVNLKVEAQKLEDLEFLTKQKQPGPFTKIDDVNTFMNSEPESISKNNRMYREIQFQKNSSTGIKSDAAVFRLKRNHKNLDTSDYAANLCEYLNHARCSTKLSMCDLRNVLNGLNYSLPAPEISVTSTFDQVNHGSVEVCRVDKENETENCFTCGEHLACIWTEDVGDKINWHLGVADKFENGELLVSYMKRADQKGLTWLFPDEAEIHLTKRDQVIALSIPVRYSVTATMRCILNVKAHSNSMFQELCWLTYATYIGDELIHPDLSNL